MLRAAAAKAGGNLQALISNGSIYVVRGGIAVPQLSEATLLEVVAANAGTLRELVMHARVCSAFILALARAAPQLRVFDSGVFGEAQGVCRILRGEPPYASLRVSSAYVYREEYDAVDAHQYTRALLAAAAAHASLTALELSQFPLQSRAALEAVVAVALSRRLVELTLVDCDIGAAAVPALVPLLLEGSAIRTLELSTGDADREPLLDAHSAAVLAAALRANSTLTELTLAGHGLWRTETAAADTATLLVTLVAHPSLRELNVSYNACVPAAAHIAGAALAALVAANAASLDMLYAFDSQLGDTVLAPLCAALPANTHLTLLDVSGNNMSAAFARDVLLPAVRANVSLRMLSVSVGDTEVTLLPTELQAVRRCSSADELAALLPWLMA